MSLIEHAERELRLAGLYDADSDYGGMIPAAVMDLVVAHARQGHSGASASLVLQIFTRLADFKALSPLTSNPEEWRDVSSAMGCPKWQNIRQSSTFSDDGGKTWNDLWEKKP